jgi:hypothetical protein
MIIEEGDNVKLDKENGEKEINLEEKKGEFEIIKLLMENGEELNEVRRNG